VPVTWAFGGLGRRLHRIAPTRVMLLAAAVAPVACNRSASMPAAQPAPLAWDRAHTQDPLTISDDGLTLSWATDKQFAWLGSQTAGRLSGGVFAWDFRIDAIAGRQIGVGIMLDPPDWGFFGYLGAGKNAWSYDAFEGAIVTETEATHTGLPTIRGSGTVSVRLDLKTKNECVFVVGGVETPAIRLPAGAVVIPAACLLKRGQSVTLANFRRIE
jgi:hypothetical protein